MQSFASSDNTMVLLLGVMKLVVDLLGVLNGVFDFLIGVLNPEVGTIVLDGVVKTFCLSLLKSTKNTLSTIIQWSCTVTRIGEIETPSCKTIAWYQL